VFAIADYPEQMADKQLLATWKRVGDKTTVKNVKQCDLISVENVF